MHRFAAPRAFHKSQKPMRNGEKIPAKTGKETFIVKRSSEGKKMFISNEPLKKFFHTASDLNPEIWVDQLFKDVFHTLPPIAEDLPPEEQNQRMKALVMMQALFIGIFSSMQLKGGRK